MFFLWIWMKDSKSKDNRRISWEIFEKKQWIEQKSLMVTIIIATQTLQCNSLIYYSSLSTYTHVVWSILYLLIHSHNMKHKQKVHQTESFSEIAQYVMRSLFLSWFFGLQIILLRNTNVSEFYLQCFTAFLETS